MTRKSATAAASSRSTRASALRVRASGEVLGGLDQLAILLEDQAAPIRHAVEGKESVRGFYWRTIQRLSDIWDSHGFQLLKVNSAEAALTVGGQQRRVTAGHSTIFVHDNTYV